MNRWLTLLSLLLFILGVHAAARTHRDPLNDNETDDLREAAQEPDKRFKLYVAYTQKRLVAVEELRPPSAQGADPGEKIHDALEDFDSLVQEISDNIDDYSRQKQDLRKPLQQLILVESDWQGRLQQFKADVAKDPELDKESRDFYFILDGALDDLKSLGENARDTLTEQNEAKSKKK